MEQKWPAGIECLQLAFLASPFILILFRVASPAAIFHPGAPYLGLMSQPRVDSQTLYLWQPEMLTLPHIFGRGMWRKDGPVKTPFRGPGG